MSASASEFSVVTFNTWKCDGDYARRLPLMCDGLAALQPDFVLLQESFYTTDGRYHTARAIAEAIGATEVRHSPARRSVRPVDGRHVESYSGLAILARHPLADYESLDLPAAEEDGQRIAQLVRADVGGRRVTLVNTHLTYLLDAHHLQQRQLERILDRLHVSRAGDGPVVLGGDLNAEPDSPTIRWLLAHEAWEARPVTNAFEPTMHGIGEDPRQKTPACVDYLFTLSPHATAADGFAVRRGERVLDRVDPVTQTYPSDHAGVRGVFAFG